MKVSIAGSTGMASVVSTRGAGVRDWQRWAPYGAVVLAIALLRASHGRKFPSYFQVLLCCAARRKK